MACYLKTRPKDSAVDFWRRTEFTLRPGTENTAGIIGLVTALELAQKNKDKENKKINRFAQLSLGKTQKAVPKIKLNGPEPDCRRGGCDRSKNL